MLSLIVATGTHRGIGKAGGLLWSLPDDLKRFKSITTGHPVVMGRKTWESIPEKYRPLPNRTNIVVTRQAGYEARGAQVAESLEDGLRLAAEAPGADEVFVIGGGELYTAALPHATRLYLTLVNDAPEADTFFPEYENEFRVVSEEAGVGDPPHTFRILERK